MSPRNLVLWTVALAWLGSALAAGGHARGALAQERPMAPQADAGRTTAWPAPVGHRQPRASDVPTDRQRQAFDAEQDRLEKALDRRLQICRRC